MTDPTTEWRKGIRLVRNDGTPIRPGDQQPGSLETVFPAVPGGNKAADAATMLIRLRPEQVKHMTPRKGQAGFAYGDTAHDLTQAANAWTAAAWVSVANLGQNGHLRFFDVIDPAPTPPPPAAASPADPQGDCISHRSKFVHG